MLHRDLSFNHLLFSFGIIEMIRGRSLPERFIVAAQGVGLTLVVSFMLLAIYNDLVRQFS